MLKLIIVATFISCSLAVPVAMDEYDQHMHPHMKRSDKVLARMEGTEDAEFWVKSAQDALMEKLKVKHIEAEAKNAIFFLGDGMSVATIVAARILKGQKVDNLPFGEEAQLHMDSFPNIGTSKTFCSDSQVADSACSATAYLTGSKGNIETIGVTPAVLTKNCTAQADVNNHVHSIIAWAQKEGKSTGVVTTTRITHASPAGTYAHIAQRDWENDAIVTGDGGDPTVCEDIAAQLILREPGNKIDVIMGGGRLQMLPRTEKDPESNQNGYRADGQNLIQKWIDSKTGTKAAYITGKDQLLNLNVAEVDSLMGLFAPSHLGYLDEQERDNDPSIEEMTKVAIQILSKNPKGFVLFVEGGRIDHAHHDNFAQRALWETIEFDKAIKHADNVTDDNDTLIVITADHAHIMTIAGYPERGNPLMGIADMADDGLPYATLGYINGPGFRPFVGGSRPNITNDDFDNILYQQPALIDLYSETHGGEDVLIMSKGPFGHLLTGVNQQSYIPHVIGYASCIGQGARYCSTTEPTTTPPTASTTAQPDPTTTPPTASTTAQPDPTTTPPTASTTAQPDVSGSKIQSKSIKAIFSSLCFTFILSLYY